MYASVSPSKGPIEGTPLPSVSGSMGDEAPEHKNSSTRDEKKNYIYDDLPIEEELNGLEMAVV